MRPFFANKKTLRRIIYSFPIQLFMVVFKKNHLLLFFWLMFFGFITQAIAPRYGAPFLFLNPEYLNKVDYWSYFIVGFSCGGFIMAFNISSYIMNGFRFPFLATLSNPFFKFCLNNFIIPVVFVFTYSVCIYNFQISNQFATPLEAVQEIIGFLIGIVSFIIIAITYFNSVNKDIFKMFGFENNEDDIIIEPKENKTHKVILKNNMEWKSVDTIKAKKEDRDWHIETYLSGFSKIKLAREYGHYEKDMLIKVFKQNHFNAAVFEIFSVITLLGLGLFREVPAFEIPAGASLFLLFTMFVMLASALHTWLRGWSGTISILLILMVNYLYHFDAFNSASQAYGMNYKTEKADYSLKSLKEYDANTDFRQKDINNSIEVLNKWRLKNTKNSLQMQQKPKLVFINTSGGGLRSALWTFYSLQYADNMLGGQLMKHAHLITGSSGGMVGAAVLREHYLQYKQKKIKSFYEDSLLANLSRDVLNPIAFSIATNDLFFRFQKFKDGSYTYTKDRGYAFEKKFNENTNQLLQNKRLDDYKEPEEESIIPMMILAPTITNDGRKLLISPQNISYLAQNALEDNIAINPLVESIEFRRFFEKQDAGNLKFTSALRMNATFPYIMPMVSLPSMPEIDVMDAGMRDNYGLETTLAYLSTFRNWISTNTSGIVIIVIRGNGHKEFAIEENPNKSLVQTLSLPLGSLYGNLFNVQDFTQNQLMQYASIWFDGKIDVVDFQLRNEKPDKISLSWHLTKREKSRVLNSINLPENQESFRKLKDLLE